MQFLSLLLKVVVHKVLLFLFCLIQEFIVIDFKKYVSFLRYLGLMEIKNHWNKVYSANDEGLSSLWTFNEEIGTIKIFI